ncbi:MAG: HEAT repeat domain-containing protein, partial [Spirochaetia bacterium]|nr:HEAT repeat domain-containing protein [Spirochaetia bacterium]
IKLPSITEIVIFISGLISVCLFMTYFIYKRRIRNDINYQIENLNIKKIYISINYPDWIILFFGNYIEYLSIKHGLNLPVLLSLDNMWINQTSKNGNRKTIKRILKYSPDKGLFTVMNAVLKQPRLQPVLLEWIDNSGEFMVLRKIALSGNGEEFSGQKALNLFTDRIDEIIEMLGDYDWKSRYFAINMLIYDTSERSIDAVWDSFRDQSVKVRISSVKLFESENRIKFYNILESLILNDPSFEVRKAAKVRINSDLQDLYKFEPFELNITQQLHLIELMDPKSKQDENIAIEFMKSGNKELELYASRYLSKNGTLKRLLLSADPGYAKGFEDTFSLLQIAMGVDCTNFLDLSDSNITPGALLLTSRLLIDNGDKDIITILIQKVLEISHGQEKIQPYKEIYENSILSTCNRGTDEALNILNSELKRRKYDKTFQKWVLGNLPENRENIFAPTLIEFLKDEKFNSDNELRKVLSKLPVSSILSEIIDIIKIENTKFTDPIRRKALKVLGSLNLPHCTQYILENLYILPLEEAKQYSLLLSKNDISAYRAKVKNILSFGDSSSMSHLIAALPESERKIFLPDIQKSLQDSNPEVRIAAVWALSDYNKGEYLSSCYDLLRDPVERVRKEVGLTLGSLGNKKTISVLKETLFDNNESLTVKRAVLHGLSVSNSNDVLNIILLKLEENKELLDESIITLSKKNKKDDLINIFNFMDKTTPVVQQNIIKSLKLMGKKAETIVETLLFNDNKILHKLAVKILEDSGIVDLRIRELTHRNPEIRRHAAKFLLKTGTLKAFRGIILAAKDPDMEVRIQVIKALDHMNSTDGIIVLEELKNDPARRVRNYTLWALERYEAKKLV